MSENFPKIFVKESYDNNRDPTENKSIKYFNQDNKLIIFYDDQGKEKQQKFDSVFDNSATQNQIYENICIPMIIDLFDGINSSLCSIDQFNDYNQQQYMTSRVSKNKRQTLFGDTNSIQQLKQRQLTPSCGIIVLTLFQIFSKIEELLDQKQFKIAIRFFEINKDQINDLIDQNRKHIKITQDPQGHIVFPSNLAMNVQSFDDVVKVLCGPFLQIFTKNPIKQHIFFQILLEQRWVEKKQMKNEKNIFQMKKHLIAQITFISMESPQEFSNQEMKQQLLNDMYLNKSRFSFVNCIKLTIQKNLEDYQNKNKILGKKQILVPFRDTKFTQILQDDIKGLNQFNILLFISPFMRDFEQTQQLLSLGQLIKKIQQQRIRHETAFMKVGDDQLQDLMQTNRYSKELNQDNAEESQNFSTDSHILQQENTIASQDLMNEKEKFYLQTITEMKQALQQKDQEIKYLKKQLDMILNGEQ